MGARAAAALTLSLCAVLVVAPLGGNAAGSGVGNGDQPMTGVCGDLLPGVTSDPPKGRAAEIRTVQAANTGSCCVLCDQEPRW
jgi:hypothetical protein